VDVDRFADVTLAESLAREAWGGDE
jgi:hypothetical protein